VAAAILCAMRLRLHHSDHPPNARNIVAQGVVKIFKCVEGSRSSMMDVEDEHNHMGAAFGLRDRLFNHSNSCSRMSTWRPRIAF